MKQILVILILILTMNIYGQADNLKTDVDKISDIKFSPVKIYNTGRTTGNDTIPLVTYENENNSDQNPAFFVNGKFVNATLLKTLDPNVIESINVVKEGAEIDHIKYNGQIHIKTKDNYNPELISLNDLKLKYATLKDSPAIFLIDNEIIDSDYDKFIVDEKYLLQIVVEKIVNRKEKLKINVVKLLTRSEDNIQRSKDIRIRGTSKN